MQNVHIFRRKNISFFKQQTENLIHQLKAKKKKNKSLHQPKPK